MAQLDPRRLKTGELARLMNSTPLGTVSNENRIKGYRTKAGFGVSADGDLERVDVFRFVAWLAARRHHAPSSALATTAEKPVKLVGYEAAKERARARQAEMSLSGRDIGDPPSVQDPERRETCRENFRLFCDTYFKPQFSLPWSPDHLKVIGKIEQAVLHGGLFAMAMPRGSGKSTLCEMAALWALVYGHRKFVAMIGADEDHAAHMLESIKSEIENNELLSFDFPEVCYPIQMLEGIHQRASGQLCNGKPTHINWTAKDLMLPVLDGSLAAGGTVRVAGITGRIRGMKVKRADGTSARPDLVLIDDPQTDESARSPSQCQTRERILAGAILGLAGPGKKIAGLMTVTVVREGDMADCILDRTKHPQWQGERTKMVYAFPTNEDLWNRYAEIRADGLRAGQQLVPATAFYKKNRIAMDEGARVAWPERHNPDEASAIQHAMNLKLANEHAFFAEYQNEPMSETPEEAVMLTADEVAGKLSGYERGIVPGACTCLTMFVDVQGKALYYAIVAWEPNFTGYVIDYGTEPDQRMPYFTLREVRRTLAMASPKSGPEGAIRDGLDRLINTMAGREWECDDGATMRMDRIMIDANWPGSTDTIYQFCRTSPHANILMPSHGKGVTAASIPFAHYKKKRGEKVGLNWRVPQITGKRAVRHCLIDVNSWKTFVHARLAMGVGDKASISLFGHNLNAHRMFAEQITSEYKIQTFGRDRAVDEWKLRQPGLDNHFLDCLVGCAVGASMSGVALDGEDAFAKKKRPKVPFSQLAEQARLRRSI